MTNKILQIAFIVFAGAFTLGFLTGAVTEYSLRDDSKIASETYTVKQGDTLMDICIEYRKRDCRDPYIFEYMDEIRRVNPELVNNKNQLQVGDEIKMVYREKQK